jgi:ABC-2 type transport system permease protein
MRSTIKAELVKLLSLKRARLLLVVTLGVAVATNIAQSVYVTQRDGAARDLRTLNDRFELISGGGATVLIVVALVVGALAVSSEYAGPTMRQTLIGFPRRSIIVQAKVAACAIVMTLLSVGYVAVAMLSTSLLLTSAETNLALNDVSIWRSAFGVVLVVAAFSAIGVGVGFVVRQVGVAAPAALGLVFVAIPAIAALREQTARFLPLESARRVMTPDLAGNQITVWTSAALLVAFALAVCAIGSARLTRNDQ